jgi:hypothetical protein
MPLPQTAHSWRVKRLGERALVVTSRRGVGTLAGDTSGSRQGLNGKRWEIIRKAAPAWKPGRGGAQVRAIEIIERLLSEVIDGMSSCGPSTGGLFSLFLFFRCMRSLCRCGSKDRECCIAGGAAARTSAPDDTYRKCGDWRERVVRRPSTGGLFSLCPGFLRCVGPRCRCDRVRRRHQRRIQGTSRPSLPQRSIIAACSCSLVKDCQSSSWLPLLPHLWHW